MLTVPSRINLLAFLFLIIVLLQTFTARLTTASYVSAEQQRAFIARSKVQQMQLRHFTAAALYSICLLEAESFVSCS